jgi:glycosyltransferase involved in cell wall biosynthesis
MPQPAPLFSIVMPHYHKSIPLVRFYRAVNCVLAQSWPLWELIILHDGPVEDSGTENFVASLTDERISYQATEIRHNDWGHSLRQQGMAAARGDYIVHMNSDNVLYPNALAILAAYSLRAKETLSIPLRGGEQEPFTINPDVLVMGVKMMGAFNGLNRRGFFRIRGRENDLQVALSGCPPVKKEIDAMQLVARREIWQEAGGWSDTSEESDGELIERITSKHGYLVVPEFLAEHW